ncbi:MAG: tripartite tricarboxylate transporter TctB family protein [Pseudonocardiaceae bacterium]
MTRRLQRRSELGVALLLLLVLGAVVLWDASRISGDVSQRGAVGPNAVPMLVGGLLVVCAMLLGRDVLRGGHGEADTGADIDLSHRSDWRTVLLLSGAFLANAALVDWAGWVISGTVLFWGSAYALGSRAYLRDLVIAVMLAVASFYLFAVGLGIGLPAGILTGIL